MAHLATGWACNLNDIFVRFPYIKFKSLMTKWKYKRDRLKIIKRVLRKSFLLVAEDIIENNVTFKLPKIGYKYGEMHMEAISGDEFKRMRQLGSFEGVDFLESFFTAYRIFLYYGSKRDILFYRKKVPVYIAKFLDDKLVQYTNEGRQYG